MQKQVQFFLLFLDISKAIEKRIPIIVTIPIEQFEILMLSFLSLILTLLSPGALKLLRNFIGSQKTTSAMMSSG